MKTKLALLLAFLVTHFFTAAWAAEVVIPDAALKAAIWQTLGKPEPVGTLTEVDMLSLTNLDTGGTDVTSVEGLGAAHNLTTLYVGNYQLTSLTLPVGLTSLISLSLFAAWTFPLGNQLTNLTLSAGLTSLTTLDLSFSTSSNFTLSGDVSHLTTLRFDFTARCDCPEGNLMNLTLSIGLTSLTGLFLSANRLTSLTLPAGLTNLTTLDLSWNQLTSVTLPTGLPSLTTLNLRGNQLKNLKLPGSLTSLSSLDLCCNQLTNLALPADLASLTILNLSANRLTSVTLPAGLTNLTGLSLGYNQLTSLTLPAGLTSLGSLYLSGNPLQSLVLPEPLAQGALASMVADLKAQGVSVTVYLPTLILTATTPNDSGNFELLLTGPPGAYRLQRTQDFSTWTNLDPVTIDAGGSVKVTDPLANARPHSFYRAVRSN